MVCQAGVVSASHISDIRGVSIVPLLERVAGDPCVGLMAPTACVSNCGPVYHTLSQTPPLNWVDTNAPTAVAARLMGNRLWVIFESFDIVASHCMRHTWHALVAHLNCLPGEQFVEWV